MLQDVKMEIKLYLVLIFFVFSTENSNILHSVDYLQNVLKYGNSLKIEYYGAFEGLKVC